jgi:hypothetical protein
VEEEALKIAVEGLKKFLEHHSDKKFKILVNEVWLKHLRDLPENAVVECLSKREELD